MNWYNSNKELIESKGQGYLMNSCSYTGYKFNSIIAWNFTMHGIYYCMEFKLTIDTINSYIDK